MWYVSLAELWENLKSSVLPHDACLRSLVHIHGAIALYLLLAMTARRGLSAWWPVCVVCALTVGNEAMDLADLPFLDQSWVWRDTGGDIFNSLIWPVGIMIVARLLERKTAVHRQDGDSVP